MPVQPISSNSRSALLRRARLAIAVTGLLLVILGAVGLRQHRASAAVVHGSGFNATVLGWTSWYGSYQLPSVGTSWCIDHGLHAPDTTYQYRPAEVDRPATTTTAMAWLLAAHGQPSRPAEAAAAMLVLHDLMGAQYPYGRLDVNTLQLANLGGFGGQEATVLALARAWKADALAHAQLHGPLVLHLASDRPVTAGQPPTGVVAAIADSAGQPVGGVGVTVRGAGVPGGRATSLTDTSGRATFALAAPPASGSVTAVATVADLHLSAFSAGPSAQRVARPSQRTLTDSLAWTPPPPGKLLLRKVDRATGAPLAGAVLAVALDADHDGRADGSIRHVTSETEPVSVNDLPPGSYLVTEITPPAGYRADRSPQRVELVSGARATVTFADEALVATITATKVDGVTGTALPGAVYDLYRRLPVGDDARDAGESSQQHPSSAPTAQAPDAQPADAAHLDGLQWVARATSDAQGKLAWPSQPPGFAYCARELSAPTGYATQAEMVCTKGEVAGDEAAELRLVDHATTAPSTTTPTTIAPPTTTPPTSTAVTTTTRPASSTTGAATTVAPPTPGSSPAPPSPPLAFTGAATGQWASVGIGLLLLGAAALASRRPRPPG